MDSMGGVLTVFGVLFVLFVLGLVFGSFFTVETAQVAIVHARPRQREIHLSRRRNRFWRAAFLVFCVS
jgi:hypothetical protein